MYLNYCLPSYMPMIHVYLVDLIIDINKGLDLLFTWLQANKLSLNGHYSTLYIIKLGLNYESFLPFRYG